MKRALRDFRDADLGVDVAFLYCSGVRHPGRGNYLIRIQASFIEESDYEIEAVGANNLMRKIAGARPREPSWCWMPAAINFFLGNQIHDQRPGPHGRAHWQNDRLCHGPNTTASDEGLYARELARQIATPGVELYDVFRNTTVEVQRQSKDRQVPRISEVSITEKIYLAGQTAAGPGTQIASLRA